MSPSIRTGILTFAVVLALGNVLAVDGPSARLEAALKTSVRAVPQAKEFLSQRALRILSRARVLSNADVPDKTSTEYTTDNSSPMCETALPASTLGQQLDALTAEAGYTWQAHGDWINMVPKSLAQDPDYVMNQIIPGKVVVSRDEAKATPMKEWLEAHHVKVDREYNGSKPGSVPDPVELSNPTLREYYNAVETAHGSDRWYLMPTIVSEKDGRSVRRVLLTARSRNWRVYAQDSTSMHAMPEIQKLVGRGQYAKTLGPVRKPHKVDVAKARSIAKAFPDGKTAMKALKYYGLKDGPEYGSPEVCHEFEFTHDFTPPDETVLVRDPSAPDGYRKKTIPAPLPKAYMKIAQSTGRVLSYLDTDYVCCKHGGKPRTRKVDLMSPEQAIRAAEPYICRAGLSMSGMRLTTVFMSEQTQINYSEYALCWKRYVNKPGFGDVEYPEAILACVDAQDGEVNLLSYKEYPPCTLRISTPKISKEQAEKLAFEECGPEYPVLAVTNLMVYAGKNPREAIRPVLTWHVKFYTRDNPDCLYLNAVIDANTARILDYERPTHGQ